MDTSDEETVLANDLDLTLALKERVDKQLRPGELLGGRYQLVKQIGRGGVGLVYLAHDQKLHSAPVVIKVLIENLGDDESLGWFKRKFEQEIKALARIDHPGVVRALDVGELSGGNPFLVMQYVEGVTLRSIIKPEGMNLSRAAGLLRQIGHALQSAHDKGVYHRDLKPENIMLQRSGGEEYVKLIDFGIATVLDSLDGTVKTTRLAGTINYMAPEQLRGKPSRASDIYALGVIAYEMVTGRRPFNPESPFQLLQMQQQGVKVAPIDLRPGMPEEAQAVILRALAFNQNARYKSARELGDDLAIALTSEESGLNTGFKNESLLTVDARQVESSEPVREATTEIAAAGNTAEPKVDSTPRSGRRFRARFAVIAALAVVALLALAWALWPAGGRSAATDNLAARTRELSYWLTVQRDERRNPKSRPFQMAGEAVFAPGDRVRLNLSSPQTGFLYVINEGPEKVNGLPDYNILFPTVTSNGGSAEIAANQTVKIPEESWFLLDDQQGVEKVWLVWAARPVSELDALKGLANPKDKGEVRDPAQVSAISSFLVSGAATGRSEKTDERTIVRSEGELLLGLIRLEHR